MGSPQTLSEADRRIVAVWAADCAERVLRLFEAEAPGDSRPRDAIARLRAFARGELGVGEARRRFVAHAAAREVSAPAAVAAARAAGQAASIPHMGAHALGASLQDLETARDGLRGMLKQGGPPPQGRFADLALLEAVKDYPARHTSTMLAFDAAAEAVREAIRREG